MPSDTTDSPKFGGAAPPDRLTTVRRRELRAIAHHLRPAVIVASAESASAVAEVDRALRDHEIIKIRVNITDRKCRESAGDTIARETSAQVVQRIGKIVVLYRANPEAKPALSNLKRFGDG